MRGDMEVPTGRAETPMPEQELDAPQIYAGFEEMGRKRVAERISTLLIIRR